MQKQKMRNYILFFIFIGFLKSGIGYSQDVNVGIKDMNTYFNKPTDEAFQNKDNFIGKKLFVANSLDDPLDPNKEIHQSIVILSKRIEYELDDRIKFEYITYENAGHVPYSSFYDGMKFIFEKE